ncbi:hypothetical protein Tco_1305846, partial [Tanacetum coccineum]
MKELDNSGEEDDDDNEDDTEDDEGNDDGDYSNDNDDDDNDANDDDNQEDDEVTKELYKDVNVNLGNEDADMTNAESGYEQEEDAHVTLTAVHDAQKTEGPMLSSSVLSDFTEKLLNFENVSPTDNEIASLMDTTVHNEEPSGQTSTLFTIPITTIPLPLYFFNPLPKQTTPTTSEVTTSVPQVDQYAQALSTIPAIVDHYIDNKLGEAIQKAIQTHNLDCREEPQAEKQEYIELVDSSTKIKTKTKIETPPLDQTKGRKEGSLARRQSHQKIKGQRKESHQVPLKEPPALIISHL